MLSLHLSDNSKVKFVPRHFNTFGLAFGLPVTGGTCPGATTGTGGCLEIRKGHSCPTCYMSKIVLIRKALGNKLQENTDLLVGKSQAEMEEVLHNTMLKFKLHTTKQKAPLVFRLHYSGDFFSVSYAQAWANVMRRWPEIKFWGYTRSFTDDCNVLPALVAIPNLALYLSVDPHNEELAQKRYQEVGHHQNIALAYMGGTTLPALPYKFVKCPASSRHISNTPEKGACGQCRLCLKFDSRIKLRNIQFLIH